MTVPPLFGRNATPAENRAHEGFDGPWLAWQNRAHIAAMEEENPRDSAERVTVLLRQWQAGDRAALDRLMPLVYHELHVIASRYMAHEWRKGTLQATGLVNEAYLKLIDQRRVDWRNRAHFFAIAAQTMRRILLDHARGRLRDKRGGDAAKIPVDAVPIAAPDSADAVD